jgi:hypothetical protein
VEWAAEHEASVVAGIFAVAISARPKLSNSSRFFFNNQSACLPN